MRTAARSIALVAVSVFLAASASTQQMRPIRDNVGFCWDATQMKRMISYLEAHESDGGPSDPLVAGISPHDDYLYAGRVYIPLYRRLKAKDVVIFGVTHGGVRKEIGDPRKVLILDDFTTWRGVRGPVAISPLREYLKHHLDRKDFIVSNRAHELEHSIEALVPFLQYYNPDVQVTPIMVTGMPFDTMQIVAEHLASALEAYIRENRLTPGRDIAFLISSDANHYGKDFNNAPFGEDEDSHRLGTSHDTSIANACLTGELTEEKIHALTGKLWGRTYIDSTDVVWCGRFSVPFGLLATEKTLRKITGKGMRGSILRYSDTYTEGVLPLTQTGMGVTAVFSLKHWVGFLSAGYTLHN